MHRCVLQGKGLSFHSESLAAVPFAPPSQLNCREWERLVDMRTACPDLPVVLLFSLESPELDRALADGLIAGYQVKPIHLGRLEGCLNDLGCE